MTGCQCKKISYHQRLDFSKNLIWHKLIKIVPKWNAQTSRYEYYKTHVPQWKVVINHFCCIHVMHWWIEGLWATKCNIRFYFHTMLNNTHKFVDKKITKFAKPLYYTKKISSLVIFHIHFSFITSVAQLSFVSFYNYTLNIKVHWDTRANAE